MSASSLSPDIRETIRRFLASSERAVLVHGEALALLTHLPALSVGAVLTDSPYSSGGMFRGDRAKSTSEKYLQSGQEDTRHDFEGDTRDQMGFAYWAALWSAECYRVAVKGAPIGLFTDWRQLVPTIQSLQAGGWTFRGVLPWDKTEGCRPQAGRFAAQCEYVVWGSKGGMPEDRIGGMCLPGLVRMMPTAARKRGHQTGKPVAVCEVLARICERGAVILDPFAGKASMGLAALNVGCRYLGFELVESIYLEARADLDARLGQDAAPVGAQRDLFGGLR